eukprot:768695-Hanusia_phi.AAC.9
MEVRICATIARFRDSERSTGGEKTRLFRSVRDHPRVIEDGQERMETSTIVHALHVVSPSYLAKPLASSVASPFPRLPLLPSRFLTLLFSLHLFFSSPLSSPLLLLSPPFTVLLLSSSLFTSSYRRQACMPAPFM